MPERSPLPSIMATPVAILVQVPPPEASANIAPEPTQILVAPVIADAAGFTVTVTLV